MFNRSLFLSVRDDGTATRLISILNTLYLAELFGDRTLGKFFWNDQFVPYVYGETLDRRSDFRIFNKQRIIGQSVEAKERIFSQSFIDKYYINNIYNYSTNDMFIDKFIYQDDVFDINWNMSLELLKDKYKSKKYKYFYVHHNDLSEQLKGIIDKDYRAKISEIWKSIDFTDCINNIMNYAWLQIENVFDKDFTVLHIRSGDVIYDFANFRKFNTQGIYHATPCELAIGIIEENKYENIVLIGDDLDSIQLIANKFNQKNIISIEDLRESKKLTNLELLFFDLAVMSRANKIFGTHSALVRLALLINPNISFFNNYSIFNFKQQYKIITFYFNKMSFSNCQKAFSLFHQFILGKRIGEKFDILYKYLNQALLFDPDNDKYRIHILDLFISMQQIEQAELYLDEILSTRKKEFLNTLFLKGWEGIVYQEVFYNYLKSCNINYPNLSYVASKILYFKVGAANRVKNQLAYRLGRIMVLNSKNFFDLIKTPI
ncbi:hypothetical protein, partial [Campylobacter jejuni]